MDVRKLLSALTFATLLLPALLHAETYSNLSFDTGRVNAFIATVGGSVSLPVLPYREATRTYSVVAPDEIMSNIERGASNLKVAVSQTLESVSQAAAATLSVVKTAVKAPAPAPKPAPAP